MDTPTGPKGQDHGHAALYRVHFCGERFHRFCTGCTGTCGSDRYFPGTAEIHTAGTETDFHPDRIHVYYQYVYDQRGSAGFLLDLHHQQRRAANGRIYGDPADFTDHRLVAFDSDHQAYKPDGWNGSTAVTL